MQAAPHRRLTPLIALALAAATLAVGSAQATAEQTITSPAVADTWVAGDRPDAGGGEDTLLFADAHGPRRALVAFDVAVPDGTDVVGASLVLHATDSGPAGAAVTPVDVGWDESATWTSAPPVGGSPTAVLPAAQPGDTAVADVTAAVTGPGRVAFAITSDLLDDATYASSESGRGPELRVVVRTRATPPPPSTVEAPSVDEVLAPAAGSSNPTRTALNRRVAVTDGGRRLTVAGLHSRGVALRWRDLGGATWSAATAGRSADGVLLDGTGTGDWTASIAVADDAQGVEHAWVVMARSTVTSASAPVHLVRLDDLDAPGGPTVGPLVVLAAPAGGAKQADLAVDTSGAVPRIAVVATEKDAGGTTAVVVGWLSDLSAQPTLVDRVALITSTSTTYRYGSLAPAPDGMRLIGRGDSGHTFIWSQRTGDPATAWSRSARAFKSVASTTAPNGHVLDGGATVLVGQPDGDGGAVLVQHVSADGATVRTTATLDGYDHPVITGDGTRAWLVAVRRADRSVVSRLLDASGAVVGGEVLEIPATATGGLAEWPSVPRAVEGSVLVLVRGATGGGTGSGSRHAVVASTRPA